MMRVLFFGSLLLGSLGRISFFASGQGTIYLFEPFIALYVAHWFWLHRGQWQKLIRSALARAVMLFIAVLEVGIITGFTQYTLWQNTVAILYLGRLSMYLLALIVVAYELKHRADTHLSRYFNKYTMLVVAVSVVQFIFFPSLWPIRPMGWDPHLFRMVGTIFDVSVAASVYGLLFWRTALAAGLTRRFRIFGVSVLGLCLLLTFSRSAYLAMIVAGPSLLVMQPTYWRALQRRSVIIGGIATLLAVVGLFAFVSMKGEGEGLNLLRTSTISSRANDYREGLIIYREHPVLGVGYNRIRAHKSTGYEVVEGVRSLNHAGAAFHSSFLTILVTGGALGLLAFLYLLYQVASISPMLRIQVIFLSVASLFDNVLLHPIILALLLLSVATSVYKKHE